MNSGTPLRLTRELLLCCCKQRSKHHNDDLYHKTFHFRTFMLNAQEFLLVAGAYFDEVLQFFVLLLQLFEDIDSLGVMATELSIHLLHLLCIFI